MAASSPTPPSSPTRRDAPALPQQHASRRPTVKQDQQILLADKAGRAAQTTLRAIQELGYEATPTGKLVLKRGPNGEPMAVKELTLKRDTTLGQKTLVVVKAGLTLIATLGLSGHNPFFRSELKREWGAQTITAYSQDLTPQEQREADKMIVDDVTVKTKDGGKYNITVQVDTSAYAEKIYNENPAKFTSVESKGMFCIINGDKGRVLHVPYSDGQHPDFSKACVMEYTDSRTGEYITGAEVSGRLVKSAKQYSILYSSLLASSKDSILKAHAHLLTDDALDEAATEHLSKLLSIQGPKGIEGIVQEFTRINTKIADINTEFMGAPGSPAPSDSKKARLKAEKAELKAEKVALEAHLAAIRKYNDGIQRDKAVLQALDGTFAQDVIEANAYKRRVDAFEASTKARSESATASASGAALTPELTTKLETTKKACITIALALGGPELGRQFEASLQEGQTPLTLKSLYEASLLSTTNNATTAEQKALYKAELEKGLVGRIEYRLDAKIRELKAMAPTADPVQDATDKKVALAAIADMQKGLRIAIREAGGGDLAVARADLKYAEKLDDKVKAAEAREAIRDYKAKVRGLMDATYSSFEIDAHGIPKPLASAAQRSSKSNPLRGVATVAEVKTHMEGLSDGEDKRLLTGYLTARTGAIDALVDKAGAIITQKRAEIQAKIDAAEAAHSPHPDLDAKLAALQVHLDALGDRDTLTDQVLLKAVDAATQISAESRDELNTLTAGAFESPPVPIPDAAAGLITARQRSAQLEGILQQKEAVMAAEKALDADIEREENLAEVLRYINDLQPSLEHARTNPAKARDIPTMEAELKDAEQELNNRKAVHYASPKYKDRLPVLEANFKTVTKAETNMRLEVEALQQYEAAVEDITTITAEIQGLTAAIDASASQASLTSLFEQRQKLADAQAKAGGALDKLFSAYSVQKDGTVQPAVNAVDAAGQPVGQPQLRTRADRKARMEAAIGRVSFDQVYMDPRGAGEGGKIKIGNSGLRWDPNLGAYVEKNKYYQSGSGFEVEVPDQVLEQMLDIYRPAKNPDSKPATKPAAAAA